MRETKCLQAQEWMRNVISPKLAQLNCASQAGPADDFL
jgi:hypothetical protein